MMIAGRDQGAAAQITRIVALRLLHRDLAQAVQAVGEGAGEHLRHVLHDDDAGSVRRQHFQQRAQRLGAAGGGADHHHLLGGFEHGPGGRAREWRRR